MERRVFWPAAAVTVAAVAVTRWAFRSHYLLSWDSANFALAMERIDIAGHRPHPPGYIAYVFLGRLFDLLVGDANTALVLWTVIAAALAAVVLLRFAMDLSRHQSQPVVFVVAAVSMLITSPLFWMYSSAAEIYPSELLVALVLAFGAWRALHGSGRALAVCAVLLPVGALFKLTAALFMVPLIAYAWWHAAAADKKRALVLATGSAALVAAVFLIAEPALPRAVWQQFTTATGRTTVAGSSPADVPRRFNKNLRDTFTAATALVGVVNLLALVAWIAFSRKLPTGLGKATALLWIGPWLCLCVLVHIGNPGYFVPPLPALALVIAGFYARLPRALAWTLTIAQAAVNVAHFTLVTPLPPSITGGARLHRTKTFLQRMASDLQPLTFATAHTIRQSDEESRRVLAVATETCPQKNGVIIAEVEPMDARRIMAYLPDATVVFITGPRVLFTGRHGDFTSVTDTGTTLTSACPVLWVMLDDKPPEIAPPPAPRAPGAGLVIPARAVHLTPTSIRFAN